jgi:lipoprotein-releasing system ATP-binding protein
MAGVKAVAERGGEGVDQSGPAVSCRGLHRHLGRGEGRVHALQDVSLDLVGGRSYAIVGPSGCGKSTLLYSLGLLDRPDAGEVRVGGVDFGRVGEEVRTRARLERIGFVFQFHFLLAEFSALENVMLPMQRLGRLSGADSRDRARELLEKVGLGGKAKRMANHLSGGERQRVAVARALANEPTVILADEPTGNLDAANGRLIVDLLVGLTAEKGRALAIVTHNPEVAERCGDEITMRDGRISGTG